MQTKYSNHRVEEMPKIFFSNNQLFLEFGVSLAILFFNMRKVFTYLGLSILLRKILKN